MGRGGGYDHRSARCRSMGKRWSLRHYHGERSLGARRSGVCRPASGPVRRRLDPLWTLAHRDRRLAHVVGADDGKIRLAAETLLLATERASQRLRHRVVATFDLHRLHAAPVVDRLRFRRGRWLRAWRSARLVEALQLLGHARPQADWTRAGDGLDSLHILLLPDDLRRERVHRCAIGWAFRSQS